MAKLGRGKDVNERNNDTDQNHGDRRWQTLDPLANGDRISLDGKHLLLRGR